MDKLQIRRNIGLSILPVIVSFIAFLQITKHSDIKLVEVLITVVLGMSISALIFNLAHLYNTNKTVK